MVNNLESIVDQFFNSINPDERPFVRKYLNWVCQQTKGLDVLDVSSYKGIVSILLINLGKKVTEITNDEESISFLKSHVKNMKEEERSRFRLLVEDAQEISDSIGTYDTIIMTDHQINLKDDPVITFLKKSIRNEGRLVFTHPFGVYGNDFTENASSYGISYYPLLEHGFKCSDVEIYGVELNSIPHYWLCVSFDFVNDPRIDSKMEFDDFISRLEQKIARKEYETLAETIRLTNVIEMVKKGNAERDIELSDSLENMIYSLLETIRRLRKGEQFDPNQIKFEVNSYIQNIENLEKSNAELILQIDVLKNELNERKGSGVIKLNDDFSDLQQRYEIIFSKLRQAIKMLENELEEEEEILRLYQELQKKHQRLEVRYDALSGSLAGRMTLQYWEFLKNKPRSKRGS